MPKLLLWDHGLITHQKVFGKTPPNQFKFHRENYIQDLDSTRDMLRLNPPWQHVPFIYFLLYLIQLVLSKADFKNNSVIEYY